MIDPNFEAKLEAFRALLEQEQREALKKRYPDLYEQEGYLERECSAKIVPGGKKYVKVDYGRSGKYMVEISTGAIRKIKAYGVPNMLPQHQHGTLDTIHDYYWGDYEAMKKVRR